MRLDDIEHKRKLLQTHKRVLQERELQVALLGIQTDPHIRIDIEERKKVIAQLEKEIQAIPLQSSPAERSSDLYKIRLQLCEDIKNWLNHIDRLLDRLGDKVFDAVLPGAADILYKAEIQNLHAQIKEFKDFHNSMRIYLPPKVDKPLDNLLKILSGVDMTDGIIRYYRYTSKPLPKAYSALILAIQTYIEEGQ